MHNNVLFNELVELLRTNAVPDPATPNETPELLLSALWSTACGAACSLKRAKNQILQELSVDHEKLLRGLVDKRLAGTSLPNITGLVDFLDLELYYHSDVLIPRPETELLAHTALELLGKASDSTLTIGIDLGCGCGNISCAIATRIHPLQLYAVDITQSSVALTRKNVSKLHLERSVTVLEGDLFSPLANLDLYGNVDFIVSNPPYIPSSKLQTSHSHLLVHEPKEAFDGGIYGFSLHQRIIRESVAFLKPGGTLMFEFGLGQEKQITALFNRARGYEAIEMRNDAHGNARVVIARTTLKKVL